MNNPRVHPRELPLLTGVIAVLAVVTSLCPSLLPRLQFDGGAVSGGEVWRVLTCHFTHWTGDHLFWSVLAFAVLGAVAESAGRGRAAVCVVASMLVIPPVVAWARPGLATYRGLSGV